MKLDRSAEPVAIHCTARSIAILAALVQILGGCATSAKTQPESPASSAQTDPCDPSRMKPAGMTAKDMGFAILGLPLAPFLLLGAAADLPQALRESGNPSMQSSSQMCGEWAQACRPCVQLANEALAKYPVEKWRFHGCECITLDAGRAYEDPAPASSVWAKAVPIGGARSFTAPDDQPLMLSCRSNSNLIRIFPTGDLPAGADEQCRQRFRATCYDIAPPKAPGGK